MSLFFRSAADVLAEIPIHIRINVRLMIVSKERDSTWYCRFAANE